MSMTSQMLRSTEESLRTLEGVIRGLRDVKGGSRTCYEIEAQLKRSLPELRRIAEDLVSLRSNSREATPSPGEMARVTRLGFMVVTLRSRAIETLREVEDASCSSDDIAEHRVCLQSIENLLDPVSEEFQDWVFRLPIDSVEVDDFAFGEDPIGEALQKLSSMRRGVPVKARLVTELRRPDPLFEIDEINPPTLENESAPFVLPLPATGERVYARDVDTWPIMPPTEPDPETPSMMPLPEAMERVVVRDLSTPIEHPVRPIGLPDPPFETGEMGVPFDLPLPGTWVPVEAIPGNIRLPDPIGFDEPEGSS